MTKADQKTILSDRYELREELGRGGMGVVYRAHDMRLNRDVAVKLLTESAYSPEGREKLLHEAQAIASLNHPNIVAVYDAGETEPATGSGGPAPFIVMELVEGKNLHGHRHTDLAELVRIAGQICAALDHAHSQGIVHRDLKPENVVITPEGTAKLMDFGIARSMASRLTVEGQITGTVFYLAPEIALGKEYDGRADLYSLGVMLYELTTGELPFAHGDPLAVISQHLHASVVPPRAKNQDVPPRLDSLIVQLMQKAPEARPASAAELKQALERPNLLDPEANEVKGITAIRRIVRGRFVGREQELAEAKGLWNKALGGEGQILLISGEPGIGKTRLVRELATHVGVTGGKTLIGECEAAGGAPYAPFTQIIRNALKSRSENGFHLPEFVLADLLKLTPDLKPYYLDVPLNPVLEPQAEQQRLFENVVAFCEGLSERSPLLLVLDDAHWADSGTLVLMGHLARRIAKQRILLLATYRELELAEARPFHEALLELNRRRLGARLKLSRFDKQRTREMLAAIFEEEITPDFLEGIYGETEGNPFFVEEVCKSLIEEGQVFHTGEGWDRLSMAEMEIPQSVKVAIEARVSKLPEEYRDTLNLAAILGREFDFDTLAGASELNEDRLIEALEAAEDAQLIEEINSGAGVAFSFTHALIPATLSEGVRTLRRRKLHLRAAQAIETVRPGDYEDLAQHYEEAGDDEKASNYYTLAGERALAVFANFEAEQHYRAALELAHAESKSADLQEQLGVALNRQGRYADAIDTWKEAIRLHSTLRNHARVAWCYARMGRAEWSTGDAGGALRLCEKGLRELAAIPPSPELADLIHETARAHLFAGRADRARVLCDQALEMAQVSSASEVEIDALITLGVLPSTPLGDSIEILESAVRSARHQGLAKLEIRARHNMGYVLTANSGDLAAARTQHEEAAEIARRSRAVDDELVELCYVAVRSIDLGELAYAEAILGRCRLLLDRLIDPGVSTIMFDATLAYLHWARGDLETAATNYRSRLEVAKKDESNLEIVNLATELCEILVELRDFAGALEVLRIAIEAADNSRFKQIFARTISIALTARTGNSAQARQLFEQARDIFQRGPQQTDRLDLSIAECHVLVAETRWEEALKAFDSASRDLADSGSRLRRTRLLRDWAAAHVSRGQPGDVDQARELLREALSEFESMGAHGYVERVQAQLQAL